MDLFDFPNWTPRNGTFSDGFDFRRVKATVNLLRTWLEVGVGLSLLLWAVHRLPFAVRISGEFFRRVAAVVTSPLFVFIFGNAIVATIIAKSRGGGNGEDSISGSVGKNGGANSLSVKSDANLVVVSPSSETEAALVYDEKRVIAVSQGKCDGEAGEELIEHLKSELISVSDETCEDDLTEEEEVDEKCEQCPEDELSDAEFQRAVDEFIAKHLKLRRDESLAIVVNPNAQLVEPIWS